jgi:hypothetical protein
MNSAGREWLHRVELTTSEISEDKGMSDLEAKLGKTRELLSKHDALHAALGKLVGDQLPRVKALIEEISVVDAELAALIGVSSSAPTQRRCGVCGEPGHRAKNGVCPKGNPPKATKQEKRSE